MPNSPENNNEQTNFFFDDATFSSYFVNFNPKESSKLSDVIVTNKIKQLYGTNEIPHYYTGSLITSEFNKFAASDEGKAQIKSIQSELEICFQKLSAWAVNQKLEVVKQEWGASISSGVDKELTSFYSRLLSGEFSDRTLLFYGDGKKQIETLTLLLEDSNIDLSFRQNELIGIAADGNLELCAEGCFVRFDSAANNLKLYADLDLTNLKWKFIRSVAQNTVNQPVVEKPDRTYAQKICLVVGLPAEQIAPYEIHASVYLVNRLLQYLNPEFPITSDNYAQMFERLGGTEKEAIYQSFLRVFRAQFTVKEFIDFIKNEFYRVNNIEFGQGTFELGELELSDKLKVFGTDPNFGLHEVAKHEGEKTVLPENNRLALTLLNRLFQKEVLDSTNQGWISRFEELNSKFLDRGYSFFPVTSKTSDKNYQIVPANLELTWLTVDSERVFLINCLQDIPNCFETLKGLIPGNQIESLFITTSDLSNFFSALPKAQHVDAVKWMKEKGVKVEGILLNKFLFDSIKYPNILLHKFNYLQYQKLFSAMSESALPLLIKDLNAELVNSWIKESLKINNVNIRSNEFQVTEALKFIRLLREGGFSDFSLLKFTEPFKIDSSEDSSNLKTYLEDIDFSNCKIDRFHTAAPVHKLNFQGSTLAGATFQDISLANFKGSKGFINVNGDITESSFLDANLDLNIYGETEACAFVGFSGTVDFVGDVSFTDMTGFKGNCEITGNVRQTTFRNFAGKLKIAGAVNKVELVDTQGTSLRINGNIYESELRALQFNKIKVRGTINNCFLTSMDFRNVVFVDPSNKANRASNKIFKVHFNFDLATENDPEPRNFFENSQFSTKSLTEFLSLSSVKTPTHEFMHLLRYTDLTEVNFQDPKIQIALKKFQLLDLTGANLRSSNFDHFFHDEPSEAHRINFAKANLKAASFDNANFVNSNFDYTDLSDCDISTANLELSSFKGTTISNLRLNPKQLTLFYAQGHRDFFTIHLSGSLDTIDGLTLAHAKLSSQAFEHLIAQRFKNFDNTDLSLVSKETLAKYDHLEDLSFKDALYIYPEPSITACVKRFKRNKRDVTCLIDEEDLESIKVIEDLEQSEKTQDLNKISIDSDRLIDLLKTTDGERRQQLIRLANQEQLFGSEAAIAKVNKLITLDKWVGHYYKVSQIADYLVQGVMVADIISGLAKGNYQDVAINTAFLAGGPILGKLSLKLETMGTNFLALEERFMLGTGLRLAAPFLPRTMTLFIVYDLWKSIESFKAGNKDAVVNIVGDSIFIAYDITAVGVEVADILGVISVGIAPLVSAAVPILAVAVIAAPRIYAAVQVVKHEKQIIHLTTGEEIEEGFRAFFKADPQDYLTKLIETKTFNEERLKQDQNLLKGSAINYLFRPTEQLLCRMVPDEKLGLLDPLPKDYVIGERCYCYWSLKKVCDQIKVDYDNYLYLDRSQERITFGRDRPDNPNLVCYPAGSGGTTGLNYQSENILGIRNPDASAINNLTLIKVGEGADSVHGFPDSANIIVAGNGHKDLTGGNVDDIFILNGGRTTGYLSGMGGENTLNLESFAPNTGRLTVVLGNDTSYLASSMDESDDDKKVWLSEIHRVYGRSNQSETFSVRCDTSYIRGNGGSFEFSPDNITIPDGSGCIYNLQIDLAANTFIKNQAADGLFFYKVKKTSGSAEISFENPVSFAEHKIFFNHSLSEIRNIQFLAKNKVIVGLTSGVNEFNLTLSRSGDRLLNCTFVDAEMHLSNNKTYTMLRSNETVADVIQEYSSFADKLQGMLFVHTQNQTIAIGHTSQHNVLQNDPLRTSHLLGNGGDNIYQIIPNEQNEPIKIILYPQMVSGNSQKNSYQIIPVEQDKPSPDLQIELLKTQHIDSLDLREIVQKIEASGCTASLKLLKKDRDLHLVVEENANNSDHLPSKLQAEVILREGAMVDNWDHLVIIARQSFLEIKADATHKHNQQKVWHLVPIPLKFDDSKKIIVISAQDVEPNTKVILPAMPGGVDFARMGGTLNHLVLTAKDISQPRTILIKDFYTAQGINATRLSSLLLQFDNNIVNLTDIRSQSLPSLSSLVGDRTEATYRSVLDSEIIEPSRLSKGSLEISALVAGGVGLIMGLAYFFLKQRRTRMARRAQSMEEAGIAMVALLSQLPQTEARPIIFSKNDLIACHNLFASEQQCAKSQTRLGTVILCANGQIGFAWIKDKNSQAAYISNSYNQDCFELRSKDDGTLAIRIANQCQQTFNLRDMQEISEDEMLGSAVFQELQRQRLERQLQQFKKLFFRQAQQTVSIYLGEQCLIHTRLGDFFQALGLAPNWPQRDVGYWFNRIFRSSFSHSLLSMGSVSAVVIETSLLLPRSTPLAQDTKFLIRFIMDLLQFGGSASNLIGFAYDFLLHQHPLWSYEKSMGLRAGLLFSELLENSSSAYLLVMISILPLLPELMERFTGIPVTRGIHYILNKLIAFFLPIVLMQSIQEDPQRVEAQVIALQTADQRVIQGRQRIAGIINTGASFFARSNCSQTEANDVESSNLSFLAYAPS